MKLGWITSPQIGSAENTKSELPFLVIQWYHNQSNSEGKRKDHLITICRFYFFFRLKLYTKQDFLIKSCVYASLVNFLVEQQIVKPAKARNYNKQVFKKIHKHIILISQPLYVWLVLQYTPNWIDTLCLEQTTDHNLLLIVIPVHLVWPKHEFLWMLKCHPNPPYSQNKDRC